MRRALEEYRILGVKTNIPFHQNIIASHRFMAGQFDTRFVEERFSMNDLEEGKEELTQIAAIMATLVEHRQHQKASQIYRKSERDTSNWKWLGRWERVNR
jgi:acetyl-CoA carboxylase biotin carboxylase subunit